MNKDTFLKIWFEWSLSLTLSLPHELNGWSSEHEAWELEVGEVKMERKQLRRKEGCKEQPGGETVESTVSED